jgi:hypothetical protein
LSTLPEAVTYLIWIEGDIVRTGRGRSADAELEKTSRPSVSRMKKTSPSCTSKAMNSMSK